MKSNFLMVLLIALDLVSLSAQTGQEPARWSWQEIDGLVSVEAEHFQIQSRDSIRKWYKTSAENTPSGLPDGDAPHLQHASGGAYLEILPDTRRDHDEKLVHGENFSNEPGKLAVLDYPIHFHHPGRYYVWVRAYSSGSEDNGIHVGLNGEWPASGQRMQWCEGKNEWTWASRQRTQEVHCGVEKLIFLDIPSAGRHVVSFSMREDGFEFDKFVLSREYAEPQGEGPAETLK